MNPLPTDASLRSIDLRKRRSAIRKRVGAHYGVGRMRAGMSHLADELEQRPDCLNRTLVWDILGWVPRMTSRQRSMMLRHIGASEYVTFGNLTDRQLDMTLMMLRSAAAFGEEQEAA